MNSLNRITAKNILKSFHGLVECGCMMVSNDCELELNNESCGFNCPVSDTISRQNYSDGCLYAHKNAVFQAERFGGKYIYFCPAGFVFCIAQVIGNGSNSFLMAGPLMATDRDNYVLSDLTEQFNIKQFDIKQVNHIELNKFIEKLPFFSAEKITYISDILLVIANHVSGFEYKKIVSNQEKIIQQQQINDYIQSIKARLMLGIDGFMPYPYDKEKLLSYAIMTGNISEAKKYLNEILGHIFFASANNLDAIKIRAMELTVLISRAALDGGADMNNIYQLNLQFISDFFNLDTIEDVCLELTEILKKFSEETFNFAHVKHVDLLSKAVSYIRTNYMHKITLEDVAEHIYLSPSYLSKIFKDEMKTNFNNYLNLVRIEKGKILLLSEQLSIIEVSELVGFFDQSYFNKVFKKITGFTPKKYREQNGKPSLQ